MKGIVLAFWFACLLVVVSSAQVNEPALKLTGIINLPYMKSTLLEFHEHSSPSWVQEPMLSEGERRDGVEVLRINADDATVKVSNNGEEVTLNLEEGAEKGSQTEKSGASDMTIQLRDASLQQVLDLYGVIKERTVLQHPSLRATRISLSSAAKTRSDAAKVLEDTFRQNGMAVIPDGTKFVMIVPVALTNTAIPKSREIQAPSVGNNSQPERGIIPKGQIDFNEAALGQVLDIYGELTGRKLVNSDGQMFGPPIRLRTANPLTKDEAIYAIATMIEWSGYKIVFAGDKEFKLVLQNSASELMDK
jgi:hypothetical protein